MTFIAHKLRKRGSIRKPVQTPNASGGFDHSYEIVTPLWLELKPINSQKIIIAMYTRGVQTEGYPTHVVRVRRAPGIGVDFIEGAVPSIRSDYVIFVDGANGQGRMFKMYSSTNVDERGEIIEIIVKEIEPQGQLELTE